MRNYYYIIIAFLFSLIGTGLFAGNRFSVSSSETNEPILFVPHWKVGDVLNVSALLEINLKSSSGNWACRCENMQRLVVTSCQEKDFVLEWYATGFLINMFVDSPGPLFEWADKLQKNDTLRIQLLVNKFGLITDILNKGEVKEYSVSILNRMINSFEASDFKPFNRDKIKGELEKTLAAAEMSDKFPFFYVRNLLLFFLPYNKSFDIKQPKSDIEYKELPTLNFSVPIEILVKLSPIKPQIYRIQTSNLVQPFVLWRIKPKDYLQLDFSFSENTDIEYDSASSWMKRADYKYHFEREEISIQRHILFEHVN